VGAGRAQGSRIAANIPAIEDFFPAARTIHRPPWPAREVFRFHGYPYPFPGKKLGIGHIQDAADRVLAVSGVKRHMPNIYAVSNSGLGIEEGSGHLAVVYELGASSPNARAGHDLNGIGNAPVILDKNYHLPGVARTNELHAFEGQPDPQHLPRSKMAVVSDAVIEKVVKSWNVHWKPVRRTWATDRPWFSSLDCVALACVPGRKRLPYRPHRL
jgi:hypothetical protein